MALRLPDSLTAALAAATAFCCLHTAWKVQSVNTMQAVKMQTCAECPKFFLPADKVKSLCIFLQLLRQQTWQLAGPAVWLLSWLPLLPEMIHIFKPSALKNSCFLRTTTGHNQLRIATISNWTSGGAGPAVFVAYMLPLPPAIAHKLKHQHNHGDNHKCGVPTPLTWRKPL